jgi:thioredoxin 1
MSSTHNVPTVTDASFEHDVLQHDKPVLVDFWARWCPPCHMIAPVLEEIAAERADSLAIRKIDADENPSTVRKYQVLSMPTLMLFRNGEPVGAFVGAQPKTRLLARIDDALR